MTTKEILKELSIAEVFGMTVVFILTCSIVIFLTMLAYYFAKQTNLI